MTTLKSGHRSRDDLRDAAGRLSIRRYDAWHSGLDRALAELPEMPSCPHELFRRLALQTSGAEKRFILTLDAGSPVAIAGLRRHHRHWRPMCEEIAPGAVFPAVAGYVVPALKASGLDIWVSYLDSPPPQAQTRAIHALPRFSMPCGMDYERFWHETGQWGLVKWARRSGRRYTFEVDAPGAAADTIERSIQRWSGTAGSQDAIRADMLIAAAHYGRTGQLKAFRLLHDGTPIAGHNFFVDGGRLLFQSTWHAAEYRKSSPGTRLLDLVMWWARESGYDEVDLGGGHGYKARWAPCAGHLWGFNVSPRHTYEVKRLARVAARTALIARDGARGLRGGSPDMHPLRRFARHS
ncbi:MAG TPA: GNAT family N-acetyltransferase [Dehalococcoidia bacterium]|jgi:hypothetical protein